MNPVPWLQMTNMISYQGLVRTFLSCFYRQLHRYVAVLCHESERRTKAKGTLAGALFQAMAEAYSAAIRASI